MKKTILHSVSLIMAFVVLLSSTGYAKYIHTCKITQKKEVSITPLKSCCKEKASSNSLHFKKSACCSLEKSFNKVSTEQNPLKKIDFKFTEIQFISFNQFSIDELIIENSTQEISLFPNPPPNSTSKKLSLLQTYLI